MAVSQYRRAAPLLVLSLTCLGSLTAHAGSAAPPLPRDVPAHHWAAKAVKHLVAIKVMTPTKNKDFRGDAPVTRYELAVTLDRFVRYIEQSRKPLITGRQDLQPVLPKNVSAEARAALNHLVSNGFIPVDSPLVTKPGTQPATASELSMALAQVSDRLVDRGLPKTTHD